MSDELNDAEVVAALTNASIPKRYHFPNKSLIQHGEVGAGLKKWIEAEAREELKAGVGRTFHGDTQNIIDLFYLTAKGLTITRNSVLVVPLVMLAKLLYQDEFRQRVGDTDVLFVLGFYDSNREPPYTGDLLLGLDWFFRRRLMDDQATILQVFGSELTEWWSNPLTQLIAEKNTTIFYQ